VKANQNFGVHMGTTTQIFQRYVFLKSESKSKHVHEIIIYAMVVVLV